MEMIIERIGKISSVKGFSVKEEEGLLRAMIEFKIETSDLNYDDIDFFAPEIKELIQTNNPFLKQAVFEISKSNLKVDYIPKANNGVETLAKEGTEGLIIPDCKLNGLTVIIKNNIPTFIMRFVKEVDSRLVHLNYNCGHLITFSVKQETIGSVET